MEESRPSDTEILQYEQNIKDEEAQNVPLVCAKEPLSKLEEEFHDNPSVLSKIKQLKESHSFQTFRKCRGDGNCFYRAFAFLYFEYYLNNAAQEEYETALKLFESTKEWLKGIGYQEYAFEDFYDVTHTYLSNFRGVSNDELMKLFQTDDQSNAIVVYFRLICSSFLQQNADEYFPYLDTPVNSMAEFCTGYVEAFGRDADQIHIIALSKALQLRVDVSYLDATGSSLTKYTFGEDYKENNWMHFLYRPGHYDMLYF